MRSWIATGVWLLGAFGFGCGLERIDFQPAAPTPDGGTDAGPPPGTLDYDAECRGAVSVCNGLAEAECDARAECSFVQACAMRLGFRCSELDSAQECLQVAGCLWDDRLGLCDGFPETDVCERFAPASCAVAAACELVTTPTCFPKRGCSQVPMTECSTVPGCTSSCRSTETLCGDQCADLDSSSNHCGGCGAFCAGRCEGGQCFAYGPCTTDADCAGFDDGNACTGRVQCVGGGCQRTPPVTCDDGLECTSDRCDPVTGTCLHEGRDGYCALSDRCEVGMGCVPDLVCTGSGTCPSGEVCVGPPARAFCVPEGESGEGAICDSRLECRDGLDCIESASDVLGICGTACLDHDDCPGGRCLGGTCSMRCSLLASDTVCGPMLRCQHLEGVALCIDNRGALGEGSSCTSHTQCERGLLCIRSGEAAACRAACDYDGSRACSGGRRCTGLDPELLVYGREYGACL
ncbi:MAG: hypothetical protein MUE69_02275 [Myxococcota bacterium]|jgi:hypothetical protein|nr:hypothetical protein [Myxococcota bacterium]